MRVFFEKMLPKAGFVLNILSSVGNGIVDLLAMRIMTKSTSVSIATGVLGTITGTALNWLIFLFSNTRQDYAAAGKMLDQQFSSAAGQSENCLISCSNKLKSSSYKVILARITLTGAVLVTTTLDSISQYQEIQTMSTKAREGGMNFPEGAATALASFMLVTNFITEFWTYNSFANLAIERISSLQSVNDSESIHNIDSSRLTEETRLNAEETRLNL